MTQKISPSKVFAKEIAKGEQFLKSIIPRGYITEKQAAKILGKSQKILQNYRYNPPISGQKLPFIKHNGRILYKKSDVIRYKDTLVTEAISKDNPNFSMAYGKLQDKLPRNGSTQDQLVAFTLWTRGSIYNVKEEVYALQKKIIEINEEKLKKEKFDKYYNLFMIGVAAILVVYCTIYRIF